MLVNLVQIGGSKGVIIPRTALQQYNIPKEFEMKINATHITLKPVYSPRKGWAEAFGADNKKPEKLDEITNKFDEEEWKW
jgi:antitoxin MazE